MTDIQPVSDSITTRGASFLRNLVQDPGVQHAAAGAVVAVVVAAVRGAIFDRG